MKESAFTFARLNKLRFCVGNEQLHVTVEVDAENTGERSRKAKNGRFAYPTKIFSKFSPNEGKPDLYSLNTINPFAYFFRFNSTILVLQYYSTTPIISMTFRGI